jgi:hypothetical protein
MLGWAKPLFVWDIQKKVLGAKLKPFGPDHPFQTLYSGWAL